MLAATPNKQFDMELFRLALSLCITEEQKVPSSLKKYFNKVLKQAKKLADKPEAIPKSVLPEAIELALEMRSYETISSDIGEITDFDNLTPTIASNLLDSMESCSVCKI